MDALTHLSSVLVAEDDPLVLIATTDLIIDLGLRVVSTINADEALCILQHREDIRTVITDVEMSGSMDGLEFAQVVHREWPQIKILVISAYALGADDALPCGAMTLRKPYSARTLRKMLHELSH